MYTTQFNPINTDSISAWYGIRIIDRVGEMSYTPAPA